MFLDKRSNKTIANEVKEQRDRFLVMLLSTLGLSLLGNLVTVNEMETVRQRQLLKRAGKEMITAGQNF